MSSPPPAASSPLEGQIAQWRSYLLRRQAVRPVDVDELEDHLRDQIATLEESGLSTDEAFLVAVKRMGDLDSLSREFAREHSDRLWKQLVVADGVSGQAAPGGRTEAAVAIGLAVAAAVVFKVPELFGVTLVDDQDFGFYARNLSLFVLPFLVLFFVWKRDTGSPARRAALAIPFAAALVFANAYPYRPEGYTEILAILHLPIALWLPVGWAYAGGRWSDSRRRMDFIRFSGELFIYYVLIALGGGVLMAFTFGLFQEALGMDVEWLVTEWVAPCGAIGAVIVASWLVEAKQSVIENMAPVLTRIFTPLFAVMLTAFIVTMILTGRVMDIERNILIIVDLLLVLVLGLLLYSISARDPDAPPGVFDWVHVLLVMAALVVDGVALAGILSRINEFGFSPNRTAALGENLVLLVNLAWSAVLYVRFVAGRGGFHALERWQTSYIPVYSVWAAVVVVVFPPLFGWI